MTYKEKLQIEHPDLIGEEYEGGCYGCPSNYGYMPPDECHHVCELCWNQEIPETNNTEIKKEEKKVKTIKDMVEEALLDSITKSDVEDAVHSIVENMDISDMLAENDTLKDAVYEAVGELIDSVIESFC